MAGEAARCATLRIPATEVAKRKLVAKLAAKYNSTFCYEAGPTRYGCTG